MAGRRTGEGAMSEAQLYGLMAIAKEHQAAAERSAAAAQTSAEALDRARKALDQALAGLPAAAATAALEASRAGLADQGKEMQRVAAEARQTLAKASDVAARELVAAGQSASMWGLVAAFALGLGLGCAGAWMLFSKQLERIEGYAYATWAQTPEGKKAEKAGN